MNIFKQEGNKYKQLLSNTIIFSIGNIGTRLIGIVLLPFYTAILTTAEYGMADIFSNTTNLLLPIVSLSIYDAVLRYTIDDYKNRQVIISSGLMVTLVGNLVLLAILTIIKLLFLKTLPIEYFVLFSLSIFTQSLQVLLANYARGINRSKVYAVSGMLNAFIIAISSYILMYLLDLALIGYLSATIIGSFITIVFLGSFIRIEQFFSLKGIKNQTIELLKYSMPLILNAILWWILSGSSRYIILFFQGAQANGIFSLANKLPSIITALSSIFVQAWELSAVKEYQKKDTKEYFNSIYNIYCCFICLLVFGLLLFLKPMIQLLFDPAYYEAWIYTGPLLVSSLFSALSGFLATHYLVLKQTKNILTSAVVTAFVNLVISLITIPIFGIFGAVLGLVCSQSVLLILRIRDVKKMKDLAINSNFLLFIIPVFLLQIYCSYHIDDQMLWYAINAGLLIYIIMLYYFTYKKEVKL